MEIFMWRSEMEESEWPKEIDFSLCDVVLDWFLLFYTSEVLHMYGSLF